MDHLGDEFIDRDMQIPADLRPAGENVAETDSLDDLSYIPAGEPNLKYDVRSTFDSRPINAYDFNITTSFNYILTTPVQFVVFEVPEGFVAIPRNIHIEFFPTPMITALNGMVFTPQVNGADVPNNIDIPIGASSVLETFFLADEYQKVGFRIQASAVPPGDSSNNLSVRIYGNLILKTNVPYIFEVANRCDGCGSTQYLAPSPPPKKAQIAIVKPAVPQALQAAPVPVVQPAAVFAPPPPVAPSAPALPPCPTGTSRSGRPGDNTCYRTAKIASRPMSGMGSVNLGRPMPPNLKRRR